MDDSVTKTFFGIVVGGNAIGQTIASPFIGYWGNKSIRKPFYFCQIIFILSNLAYASLELFPADKGKYWMFLVRVWTGVGAGK